MAYLSISIDLAGSTMVKQALVEASVDDDTHRHSLYQEFLKLLFGIERDFYRRLLSDQFIDHTRLYLVKAIGDEFWYTYEVDEDDEAALTRSAWGIFSALLELFAADRYLGFDGPRRADDFRTASPSPHALPSRQFNLPIKAHVDLVTEPIEINVERYEYLKDIVAELAGHNSAIYTVDQPYLDACARLNLGSGDNFNSRLGVSTRTDFIGLQIDRFFRLTKFCVPLLLGVGEGLMTRLPHAVEPISAELEHLQVKTLLLRVPGAAGDWRVEQKYVIIQPVPAAQMKGLGEDYAMFHVFGGLSLGEVVYVPPPAIETLLAPTQAFLAEHGFYALDRSTLMP